METSIDDIIMKVPFKIHGYEIHKLIGKGGFAGVFKVTQLHTGHIFAAKVIHCTPLQYKKYESINSEIECMMKLLHPNIVKIYDMFKEGEFLFLILEYCSKGNVDEFVRMNKKLSNGQIINIMKQLLTAVNFCHVRGIAHRDIKPANALISSNGIIKLGDFGLGVQMKENGTIKHFAGSLCFKAPELIKKIEHDPFKADIWSLGVTFYFIATGTLPWWGSTKEELMNSIIGGNIKYPKDISETVKDVISKMIVVNPDERTSLNELLSMECFTSFRISSTINVCNTNSENAPMCMRAQKLLMIPRFQSRGAPRLSLPALKVHKINNKEKKSSLLKRNCVASVMFCK